MGQNVVIDKPTTSRQFVVFTITAGLLIGVAAFWGANKQILGLFHDDGIYAVVAQSLAQGEGYRIISLPSKPAQTKYPFLYSYVLSWLWGVNPSFPQNIAVLKGFNSALLAVIFTLSVALYRRYFPNAKCAAILFGFLVCTNPIVFTYTDYAVSDLAYVALALGALVLVRPRESCPVSMTKVICVAALAGTACLVRLAAVPLAFAGAVFAMLERGWRGAFYFGCAVIAFIAPWCAWVYLSAGETTNPLFAYYSAYDFSGAKSLDRGGWEIVWPIISGNARYFLGSFDLLYLLPLMPWLTPFVAVLTAIGMMVSSRREDRFAWTFLIASAALLLAWPFHPGRYLAPLVPLLVVFFFRGMVIAELWIKTMHNLVAKIAWAPLVLVLALECVWLSSYFLMRDEQSTRGLFGRRVPYSWAGFEESFEWIRRNTRHDSRLATAYDPMYFLYTGRQAIRPTLHRPATYFYPYGRAVPDVGSVAEIKGALEQLGIDYLVIDPLDGYAEGEATVRLLEELISAYGAGATQVFTSSDGKHRIYSLSNK